MGGLGLGADLADFAAAALKFRAETRALIGLKNDAKEGPQKVEYSLQEDYLVEIRC